MNHRNGMRIFAAICPHMKLLPLPLTNCLDNRLYLANYKACATNCPKAFPSKDFVKIHLLTAPLQIRRGGLSGQTLIHRVQHRAGASDATHTASSITGEIWQHAHPGNWKERDIFGKKRISQYVCNEHTRVKHLLFDTSQAATVDFTMFLSSFTSGPSSLWVILV